MFIDEVKRKFDLEDVACKFALSVFGSEYVLIEGVRNLISVDMAMIKANVGKAIVSIFGEELFTVEIGGGNVYVRGKIDGISFEKKA